MRQATEPETGDRGDRPHFPAAQLRLDGPFTAVGEVTKWHFLGDGDIDNEVGVDLDPERDTLTNLSNGGVAIYCTSNRCRQRYLMHKSTNPPTIVAVVVGVLVDHHYHLQTVTLAVPRKLTMKKQKAQPIGHGRRSSDLPAGITCSRCQSTGTVSVVP